MGEVEVDERVDLIDVVWDHGYLVIGHVQASQGRGFDLGAWKVGEFVVGQVDLCSQLVQGFVHLTDLVKGIVG